MDKKIPHPEPRQQRLVRWATYASVLTATTLILAKLSAWGLSGSVSMLASLIDSLMDALASIINVLAVRYALQPADNEHRFGHGKAESLAALGQATFIAGSAVFLLLHSIDRLLHPAPLAHTQIAIAVMVFSIVATTLLVLFQRAVIAQTGSVAIKADSLHYVGDLAANAGIIVALMLASYGWPGFDPVFALLIAGYVFYTAWSIGAEATQHLLDRELPDRIRAHILALAQAHPDVLGVHALRTRQSGPHKVIQLHIELDGAKTLLHAHQVAEHVENRIKQAYPGADVIIHQDPAIPGQAELL